MTQNRYESDVFAASSGSHADSSAAEEIRPYAVCWRDQSCEVSRRVVRQGVTSGQLGLSQMFVFWFPVRGICCCSTKPWPNTRPSSSAAASSSSWRSSRSSLTGIFSRKCESNLSAVSSALCSILTTPSSGHHWHLNVSCVFAKVFVFSSPLNFVSSGPFPGTCCWKPTSCLWVPSWWRWRWCR